VRPHHAFGTVEVRVCDAQTTGTEADGLAALIAACVLRAAAEVDAGEVGGTGSDIPGRLIEENMWRALRHGLDGRLLDLEAARVEEFPAAEALDRLRAWSGAGAVLPELNGAQRQRRLIEAGATPAEVYAECVRETQGTYQEETVT
jgi:carboxylate-amine ligase